MSPWTIYSNRTFTLKSLPLDDSFSTSSRTEILGFPSCGWKYVWLPLSPISYFRFSHSSEGGVCVWVCWKGHPRRDSDSRVSRRVSVGPLSLLVHWGVKGLNNRYQVCQREWVGELLIINIINSSWLLTSTGTRILVCSSMWLGLGLGGDQYVKTRCELESLRVQRRKDSTIQKHQLSWQPS